MTNDPQNSRPDDLARLQRSNLGMASWQAARQHAAGRRYSQALAGYQNLLKQFPRAPHLWLELGSVALADLDFPGAAHAAGRALDFAPADAVLLANIGNLFSQLFLMNEAGACFERAAQVDPVSGQAHLVSASWLERTRRLEEAWERNETFLSRHPKEARALCFKAFLLHRKGLEAEAETVLRDLLRDQSALPPAVQGDACQLLGVVCDAAEKYGEALAALDKAKAIRAGLVNVAALEQMYENANQARRRLLAELTPAAMARWREQAAASPSARSLALLGGAPRSGTTLIEQIIGAHPAVLIFDESDSFIREIVGPLHSGVTHGLTFKHLDELKEEERCRLAGRYHKSLQHGRAVGDEVHLLLDKNPSTTSWLPVWLRMFPDSKVVIALRDPRDVIVSCYFQNVTAEWGLVCYRSLERTARYYATCMDVWLRLRDLGGFECLEIRYEDVVGELELEGRRLMRFLGLDWHPAQGKFFENARQNYVRSPTYSEVAQPLYRRAVKRWEHYAEALAPLKPVLEPYLRALGYAA